MFQVIKGFAAPLFKPVVALFKNQVKHSGGGAALCVYRQGEPVIDIWTGSRNPDGAPWHKNTAVLSFSTSKGVLSTLLHMIMQDADLDYETQVHTIWPGFKQNNKHHISIRQLLCHEAGLFDASSHIQDPDDILDWDLMVYRLAKAAPSMNHLGEPSYHDLTYGWLIGEIIRRLTGQKPGEFLVSELRSIMGRHNFFGVPDKNYAEIATIFKSVDDINHRKLIHSLQHALSSGLLKLLCQSKHTAHALSPDTLRNIDLNDRLFLAADIPAMNGVFTARGLAQLYHQLIDQKKPLIKPARLAQIQQVQHFGRDKIIHLPLQWRLGYHRLLNLKCKAPMGFGHYGFGGSGAWCEPSRGLAVAFVTNTIWGAPLGDYRMAQLTGEILQICDKIDDNPGHQP